MTRSMPGRRPRKSRYQASPSRLRVKTLAGQEAHPERDGPFVLFVLFLFAIPFQPPYECNS
jgi:hypothetical protein